MTVTKRLLAGGLALVLALAVGGASVPAASSSSPAGRAADRQPGRADLADDFGALARDTDWQRTGKLSLDFKTYHTEGIAFAGDRVFLSAVEIIKPTVIYPTPRNGHDRSAGKGVGHLFVMDRQGNLKKDIVLGEGKMYHPGGIDFDGKNVWVPVAQYRPDSRAIIYRVNASTLKVHKQFEANDHFGGIVLEKSTGHLVGNTWGSRRFVEWNRDGNRLSSWNNDSFFIDYQDCEYAPKAKMICGGIAELPQTPSAGGNKGTYELGGMAMIDLRSHRVLREVPFQKWSTAGHVATRNPLKLSARGDHLTMRVAPDNYDEGKGTQILTYKTTVDPATS